MSAQSCWQGAAVGKDWHSSQSIEADKPIWRHDAPALCAQMPPAEDELGERKLQPFSYNLLGILSIVKGDLLRICIFLKLNNLILI